MELFVARRISIHGVIVPSDQGGQGQAVAGGAADQGPGQQGAEGVADHGRGPDGEGPHAGHG